MATPTTGLGFQNFFSATLQGDITASSTDILLDNIPNSSQGYLVIEPDSTTNREVIFYTSKTALKVVCTSAADGRGQDDTTAVSHLQGSAVIMAPVAGHLEALQSGASIANLSKSTTSFSNPYKFSVYRNAAWNTPNGAEGKVAFDAETFDTNSNFDSTTNNRYTAPVSGFYFLNAQIGFSTLVNNAYALFYKNGSEIKSGGQIVATNVLGSTVTALLQLTAGDYIEVYLFTSATQTGTTGANNTWFDGFLVSHT